MEKKEKKIIVPNECSLGRWLLALGLGAVLSILLMIPVALLFALAPQLNAEGFCGIPGDLLMATLSFAALFWGVVIGLKVVAKTSLRDFVLGVGGRADRRECLTLLGLYVLGLVISQLPSIGSTELRGVNAGEYAVLFIFMLAILWMQTSCEELIFRGLFIRWACKNEIGFTRRAVIACLVSTLLFTVAHIPNVEVVSQSGLHTLLAILSYAVPGICLYIIDLYFKSLLPGIVIHWANNFLLSTVISGEVSSLSTQTLFVDRTEATGGFILLTTLICYVPVLIYMFLDHKKKKAAGN